MDYSIKASSRKIIFFVGVNMNTPWLPFVYQYSISGIVFAGTLVFAMRKGVLNMRYVHDRWTFVQLVAGFLAMMLLQGTLIIASGM